MQDPTVSQVALIEQLRDQGGKKAGLPRSYHGRPRAEAKGQMARV